MSIARDYDSFSEVYEIFKANDDYKAWFKILDQLASAHRTNAKMHGLAWDIGTGTGLMARCLADAGWKVIGTDLSQGMLDKAVLQGPPSIQYRLADIRRSSLTEKADYAVAIDDVINTFSSVEDIRSAFSNVFLGLKPNGLFQFDLNTVSIFEHDMGEVSLTSRGDSLVVIKPLSRYSPDVHLPATVKISVIDKRGNATIVHETTQSEYYYSSELITQCLVESGFDLVSVTGMDQEGNLYREYRNDKVTKLLFLARKSLTKKGGDSNVEHGKDKQAN
ncbi:class I SAM-dependent DNA methyltransferase [Bombiscardovia coagulans]|uniref:Methyltransferase type 12 n=1 Tax=Bombiscardovia coagulans TaxID=686666 RepID=A0A261EPK5_9BIFI|nr:class I SAM-dependent methyltransferase [Bombiscardovia coagulans]OZG48788.1 Methyltransferase type 12 [Bombiscardovia coagulans]